MNEPENPLWRLADRRIREAMDRGEFENLPGAGRPLELDDDSMVPEELRAAYRLLRNAGYVPEELRLRREIRELGALLGRIEGAGERLRASRRLELLRLRLAAAGHELPMTLDPAYREALVERFGGDAQVEDLSPPGG